jgi:hypothetical protein
MCKRRASSERCAECSKKKVAFFERSECRRRGFCLPLVAKRSALGLSHGARNFAHGKRKDDAHNDVTLGDAKSIG